MRKPLFTLLLLVTQITFSQIENSYLESNLFKENIKENLYYIEQKPDNLFPEIKKLELKDIKNNTEGKFNLNSDNKKYFITNELAQKKSVFEKNEIKEDQNLKENLSSKLKTKFINKVIRKKIAREIQEYIFINEALTYGDRNIELYKNYTDLQNTLIKSIKINSKTELQIGKDIYPYLNKILKTELDKTLQNSLNLFALNF